MSHKVAGIDVHKKLLVAVVVDAARAEVVLESGRFGTASGELSRLLDWLLEHGVAEAVMESTAQYWRPVWDELEPFMRLHLAQAHSDKAPKGRKSDMADVKRLVRRFVAGELVLSFVPEPDQRSWRMMTRARLQLIRERVQLQNQIESLLEQGRIKLSSVVSDLLGASGRRILRALAREEISPQALAALGDRRLKCGLPALTDALTGAIGEIHRKLLGQQLDRIDLIDQQIEELNQMAAAHMLPFQSAVTRLVEIPGIGPEAGTGDHRRDRSPGGSFPFSAATGFLDWRLPRFQRECRGEPLRPVGQRQPLHATAAVPVGAGGCPNQRQPSAKRLQTPGSSPGICQGRLGRGSQDRHHCLKDPAQRRALYRAGQGAQSQGCSTRDQPSPQSSAQARLFDSVSSKHMCCASGMTFEGAIQYLLWRH